MSRRPILWLIAVLASLCTLVAWAEPFAAEHLIGRITAEQLYVNAPKFKENAQKFYPDPVVAERIGQIEWSLTIIMFVGTWCDDSEREAPRLLKILETANNPNISLELHAVNTALQDGADLTKKYVVKAVPTIIFFRNGRELGRIIEHPKTTMEKDFLEIVGMK